ncbi:hypothetical protein [Microcystis sp. LE19-195.1E]|uniref:hypothetical protein n=1 Tax=Microcystis sp. LE19-195.1E TaxID=3016440 RepID=UPI0025880C08|nr:hypothetical protein [Microcystis sp. LE19-195.1E]
MNFAIPIGNNLLAHHSGDRRQETTRQETGDYFYLFSSPPHTPHPTPHTPHPTPHTPDPTPHTHTHTPLPTA